MTMLSHGAATANAASLVANLIVPGPRPLLARFYFLLPLPCSLMRCFTVNLRPIEPDVRVTSCLLLCSLACQFCSFIHDSNVSIARYGLQFQPVNQLCNNPVLHLDRHYANNAITAPPMPRVARRTVLLPVP